MSTPRKLLRRLEYIHPKRWGDARVALVFYRSPRIASWFRKRWAIWKNPRATIRFERWVYAGPGFSLHMPFGGTFIAEESVEFRRGFRAEVGKDGRLVIGAGSYLTYDVIITVDTSIEIGKRCGLAQSTYVADGSQRFRDLNIPFRDQGYDYRPLKIADDVQIHAKCTIINDIGERSVIGANAVVSKPIPPFCLAAGVPARVIDYFGPPGLEPRGLAARSE